MGAWTQLTRFKAGNNSLRELPSSIGDWDKVFFEHTEDAHRIMHDRSMWIVVRLYFTVTFDSKLTNNQVVEMEVQDNSLRSLPRTISQVTLVLLMHHLCRDFSSLSECASADD